MLMVALLTAAVAGTTPAAPPAAPPNAALGEKTPPKSMPTPENLERIEFSSEAAGGPRSAWVHVPSGEGPWPVIIAYHGGKGNDGREMVGKLQYAENKGVLLVYANGADTAKGTGWTGPGKQDGLDPMRDVRYTEALIDEVARRHPIDRKRVYAVGMSGGGYMVDVLWCTMSDRIAGFGVVSRAMPKVVSESCSPAQPRPYMLVMGTADDGLVSEHQLSLDETRSFVRKHLQCQPEPASRSTLPDKGDTLTVNRTTWSCADGAQFWDYEVVGGGHTWPGVGKARPDKTIDFKATKEMMRLFGLES